MQFNAHRENVDGVVRWWADCREPGVYVAADTWDELFTLGSELAFEEFGARSFVLVGPWEMPEAVGS